jgi:hypothetical protein
MEVPSTSVEVFISDIAPVSAYSGRKKSMVFKAQLRISQANKEDLIVPDSWSKKEKVVAS